MTSTDPTACDTQATAGGRPLAPGPARALADAERAILARPRLSIRARLLGSLALCCLLCGAFALVVWNLLAEARAKLALLETIERIATELPHDAGAGPAQRAAARSAVAQARSLLAAQERRTHHAAAAGDFHLLARRLADHEVAMDAIRRLAAAAPPSPLLAVRELEVHRELAATARHLEGMVAREQVSVEHVLAWAQTAPLVLLAVLLVLFAAITLFFTRALVGPIRRFSAYTRRIAEGDFTLIAPSRPYRDEFSDLALAVNRMLAELQANQEHQLRTGRLAAVGTITSGIAHELANPLNNIALTVEALMEDWQNGQREEQWSLLEDVYFETERASEIVKSLLDFTRQERPGMRPLDLEEIVRSTARLAGNEMALHEVRFELERAGELPLVLGAANQLRQVFLNLFLNAVQAMPAGGRLRVRLAVHQPGKVCADVADEGVGIPADVLPHIFDPFFTTKEPGKGTGLGLSVTIGIVKRHGGEVQVSSEPGRGTTFHVCLPVAP